MSSSYGSLLTRCHNSLDYISLLTKKPGQIIDPMDADDYLHSLKQH